MINDRALDAVVPRHLRPVVPHYIDVIVDRAPPVRLGRHRASAEPAATALPPRQIEPESAPAALVDEPHHDTVSFEQTDVAWFANQTLAPAPHRGPQLDEAADDAAFDHLLVAGLVTLGSAAALGVALGAFFAAWP